MVGRKRSRLVTLICLSAILGALSQPSDATTRFDASGGLESSELHRFLSPALARISAGSRLAPRAALAIGRTKRRAGETALAAQLRAADPALRALAAYGLGLIADPAALDAERRLLRHDGNSAVRYAACDALGRIVDETPALGRPEVAADLERAYRTDADAIVRGHAVAQLETFRDVPYANVISRDLETGFARERDPAVRWHIMWTLFRGFAVRADSRFLRAALEDPQELVRVEAIRAFGRRHDAPAAVLSQLARSDPSWRVQFEAREALRRGRGEPPSAHLAADPPGLHLPPLPPPSRVRAALPAVRELRSAPRAPDPDALTVRPLHPVTAAQMNGPLPGLHPRALIRTTKGDVVVRLYPEWAASTVANFLALANRGYFDGNPWFRIVPDFVVQTGDPHGNGEGDAGYTIPAEENPIEQRSFAIAMGLNYSGKRPLRDSAGTQFYMTLSPQLHLDRAFSVFGEVESGRAVLAHLVESDRMLAVRRIGDD